jgi:putative redox protein
MPSTTLRWVKGQQFVGMDENGHAVVLSGENDPNGMRPSQMLLIALSACTAVDVVEILTKKRQPPNSLEIVTTGEHDPEPPWAYRRIKLTFRIGGKGLTDSAVRKAIQLSEEKYCSVAATVRGVADIKTDYEILPE